MTALEHFVAIDRDLLHAAARRACERIAPTWPLDRMIAVSPLWERRDQAWQEVAEQLWRRAGSRLTLDAQAYRQALQEGHLDDRHLQQALDEAGSSWTPAQLLHLLPAQDAEACGLPLLEDMADAEIALPGWPTLITQQIGQCCAAWFDEAQADWRPDRSEGLYQAWRAAMLQDRGLSVLSACAELRQRIGELPMQPQAALEVAVQRLGLAADELDEWFDCLLLRSLGWASWCAYRRWQARLQGDDDDSLLQLLAIRAAWEWLVDDRLRHAGSRWSNWREAWQAARSQVPAAGWQALLVCQRAEELAWQEQLQQGLRRPLVVPAQAPELARVYFCIDVRSEPLRRALEQACPQVRTGGFAGFFGLPIAYTPLGTAATRPQLPGLLAAQLAVSDSSGDSERDRVLAERRQKRLARKGRWRLFERLPASSFTLIESTGLGYAGALLGRTCGLLHGAGAAHRAAWRAAEWRALKPALAPLALIERVQLAARILRAMSLTRDFPPLILLLGHGSQSANNPQAAGLDCGACCGQSGEVNARLLADLLNDAGVRQGLAEEGIELPEACRVLAGLHNTSTDEVQVFIDAPLSAELHSAWQQLRAALDAAGAEVRRQRAARLGLQPVAERPQRLLAALRRRVGDWAQTRPEWGLAGNAGFIAAPRERTRGVDLQGRVFLHDYDWRQDEDGKVLELIMTAPMVVAHWINLQYLTSTTDNRRFGSGNKVLHNVVGGHIGVFEGNGGDLRIGLARQSLHDGERWVHRPLRLSVVLAAPQAMIERVIAAHQVVRDLVEHGWLHLLRLDDDASMPLERRGEAGWQKLAG
ncbi:YbcC family protein [Ectopseudomonas hydrolytica]|uniref:YbcC family protein n=1 Tax=Ectopseudomonas hydrolytica TaxID=2493633 RepID=UPI00376EBD87